MPKPVFSAEKLLADWGQHIDPQLLVLAMTHRSFAHEQGLSGSQGSNERLEFLGDAVLQIVVTEYLFRSYPEMSEGELSPMRAATVSQAPLAEVARGLHLGEYLLLGVGEDRTGGGDKESLLCDAFEALIGASYLSGGMEATRATIERHLRPLLRRAASRAEAMDWITVLKELCEVHHLGEVTYQISEAGPDHAKVFTASAVVDAKVYPPRSGSAKRHAQKAAAEVAVAQLRARLEDRAADRQEDPDA